MLDRGSSIIPVETKWFRDLLIARIVVETLEGMGLKYPMPEDDPKKIVIE